MLTFAQPLPPLPSSPTRTRNLVLGPGTAPLIAKRIRFCFDLDNTLVTLPKVPGDYASVEPIPRNIELVRQLHAAGHHIIIQTSRGMRDHAGNLGQVMRDVGRLTFNSLHDFDIPYDELLFGKPEADVYVGHRAVNSLIDTLMTLQMFRAIGMMVSAALPEDIEEIYEQFGIFTFDFEFMQPGYVW